MHRFPIRSWIRKFASTASRTLAWSVSFGSINQPRSLQRTRESVDGTRRPAGRREIDEILAPLLQKRTELQADAKKLAAMAHRYQAVGKIDHRSLNSLATIELRARDAVEEAARLEAVVIFDDVSARTRLLEIARELREAENAIDRALDGIKNTRQLIINGNFFR